jgi:2-polyprenyl-3-methyl-5-hydroxy-6-metoxy-1,4-benzoquinol methylase
MNGQSPSLAARPATKPRRYDKVGPIRTLTRLSRGAGANIWRSHFSLFADIAPGDRVLDVACGTGVLTKALAELGTHVISIDASEGYLEGGARHHRSHPNIAYEHGDIRTMRPCCRVLAF